MNFFHDLPGNVKNWLAAAGDWLVDTGWKLHMVVSSFFDLAAAAALIVCFYFAAQSFARASPVAQPGAL